MTRENKLHYGNAKINLTIDEFIDSYGYNIGCVYPTDEPSYYIGSDLGSNLNPISLLDGMLFADHDMQELAEAGYPYTRYKNGKPVESVDFNEALKIKE